MKHESHSVYRAYTLSLDEIMVLNIYKHTACLQTVDKGKYDADGILNNEKDRSWHHVN